MVRDQEQVLVYSPVASNRLIYLLRVFFQHIVKLPYRITTDQVEFQSYSGPRIQYSKAPTAQLASIGIPSSGFLLDNTDLGDFVAKLRQDDQSTLFPPIDSSDLYGIDLFTLCFFCLVQYELYHSDTERDALGRLSAKASISYQLGILDRPVVDEWCLHLVRQLQRKWPNLPVEFPDYQFTPTYDIDISWAYGHRPWYRRLGAIARDLAKADFQNIQRRWRVFTGQQKDPFDTFDYLDQLHREYHLEPIYFFLLGDYGGLDRNIPVGDPAQVQLFQKIARQYTCGLHPSIGTNQHPDQLQKELYRFEQITGYSAADSRQHYLLFQWPDTFRELAAQGIRREYSMGYAELPGFRAGIARPYPWYDLPRETITELILQPFLIMDQSLRRIGEKDHAVLTEKILYFVEQTRAVNGHLQTVWHNSSFSELEGWAGWMEHYEMLLQTASR